MIAPGSPTRKAGRNHAVWLQHLHIACITVYSGVQLQYMKEHHKP